jgi:hypothetical protein
MPVPDGPRYRVELRALPNGYAPVIRLRHALKALLRAYGFQAVKVEELPPETETPVALVEGGAHDAKR